MAEMSPVELLRAGADKLREIAKDATDGPWWSDQSEQCYRLHGVHAKLPPVWPGLPEQVINHQILKAPKTGTPYAEYWPSAADDAWMTTMHPGLAEPLADWLDAQADEMEKGIATTWPVGSSLSEAMRDDMAEFYHGHALAVARVLLGVPE